MNTIYCVAKVNGTKVFVELTNAQMYAGDPNEVIPVFTSEAGEVKLFDVKLGDLQDIEEE